MIWNLPRRTFALVSGLSLTAVLVIVVAIAVIVAPPANKDGQPTARATGTATRGAATSTVAPNPIPKGADWTQYRPDLAGTGDTTDGNINSANVSMLKPAWTVTYVYGYHPFESTPAVVDGVIYANAGHSLHALDLLTGKELWHFSDTGTENGTAFSSVAVDKNAALAVYGTTGGRLYAVNILTHTQAWMVQLGDPAHGANIWSSPLIVNGKVYVGVASTEDNPCVRGNVTALDLLTGHIIWTHYTVPSSELGGGVWSSVIADPSAQEIIATVGNPCDLPTGTSPQGGQVDSDQDAIIALNWNTGTEDWRYSAETYDTCDCDFGEGAALFTYQGTKYVVAGNKAGVVYALVPPTTPGGAPQLAWKQTLTHADQLSAGGVFQPPSYSNGLVFVGAGPTLDGACPNGALWALHADTGATAWRICTPSQLVGAATISGGVLLMGMQDEVVALATSTGKVLWQATQKPGQAWGGTTVSHGFVLSPMVGGPNGNSGVLYAYRLPAGAG